jgi:hypothetical protein
VPTPGFTHRDPAGRACFALALLVGIALRSRQLFENAPLWLDELALANGVLGGTFAGLFDGPSDFGQVAPPGFLVLEWIVAHLFPGSDFALRVPAFLFSVGAIWLTWLAARALVGERTAWVPAAMVALASSAILMSAQVKPYAADAFFASLIIARLLAHDRERTRQSLIALLVAGATAPLFSLGSVFVLAGAGAFLLTSRGRAVPWFEVAVTAVAWGATVLLTVLLTSRLLSPATDALMNEYWKDAFPSLPRSLNDVLTPFRVLGDTLWSLMGFRGIKMVTVAIILAEVVAWRRRPAIALLLLTPIVAAYGAALLHQYPFGTRLMNWIVPLVALLLAILIAWVAEWLAPRWKLAPFALGLAALAGPIVALSAKPPPYVVDDVRPVIDVLSTRSQPGDVLHVHWGAWHAWHRYGHLVQTSGPVYQGTCPADYPRGYLRQLDRYRGSSGVWILFGRVASERVHRLMLDYLGTIGQRVDSVIVEQPGSTISTRVDAHRFDLSDPARLARASAETFPVPAEIIRRHQGCTGMDAMLQRGDGTWVVPLFQN